MNKDYYVKIFEQSSELLVVIDTNFAIVAASDSFLKATSTIREKIIGCVFFEVFPDNPDDETANGKSKVLDSFNQVLNNKTPDKLAIVRYDIPKPESEGGGFEVKYWQAINSPLLDEQHNVKYIIQRIEDVTENKALITQIEFEKKALKQIADSEKRYNMLLMKSPFGFAVLKGKNMVITIANDSVKTFWGKGKDLEGKPLFEVISELKDSAFPGLLDNVYTTGIPFYGDELLAQVIRNGNKEDVYFNFVYQPYLEADETISGVTIIAYEVTASVIVKKALEAQREAEQKALRKIEESNKRFHVMLMQSPFAFSIMKGKDMVVTLANDLMKEFWGKGTNVEGKALLHLLPEFEGQPFPSMLDKVYTTGIPVYANEILAKLDQHGKMENRYFNIVYQPYLEADETISGVTTIAHDVTAQVIAKNKLKEAKDNAEQKTKEAEEVVKAKQQFLSNMSHEIRTPLNSIIGFTNVVLKTDLSIKQKEYINAIKVSGDALIVLINDILDLAKVDAGKMTFEQTAFALSASISAALHLFEPKIQEKNLELIEIYDSAIPEVLLGDSIRLRQIILNLLSNAVKFTDQGKITVSVRMLKEEEDNVTIEFSVTDTGIGIPENKLEHIFGDFQQATNETSRFYGGTGLGLSIVKQFVELQGGTLFVNSNPGKGSTFGFILNFKKAIAETPGTDNRLELDEKIENIRILVVEDMTLNQLLIKIVLNDFGFDVDIADNGKIAIEKLQENKYDVILMDLQMPELNGFEATEYIRSNMNAQIPIIALTADVTTVDVEKCRAVGMDDYISKPVDEKLLHSKIIKYIKKPIE